MVLVPPGQWKFQGILLYICQYIGELFQMQFFYLNQQQLQDTMSQVEQNLCLGKAC